MGKLASIIIFILLITFGCQNSNPTESSKGNIKKTLDSKEIDYTCLELSFIEDLESSWESSYKDSSLPLKGFVRIQSGPVENGHEIVFENKQQKNQLKISKLKYGDGEESFYVEYLVQPKQLLCLEEQLKENNYVVDEDDYKHIQHHDRYIKNGLDSLESKAIHIVKKKGLVSYYHNLDKLDNLSFDKNKK